MRAATLFTLTAWGARPAFVDDAKKFLKEHADLIETNEPRLISFNNYLDEGAGTVGVVPAGG
jgi:hypothetical protein